MWLGASFATFQRSLTGTYPLLLRYSGGAGMPVSLKIVLPLTGETDGVTPHCFTTLFTDAPEPPMRKR